MMMTNLREPVHKKPQCNHSNWVKPMHYLVAFFVWFVHSFLRSFVRSLDRSFVGSFVCSFVETGLLCFLMWALSSTIDFLSSIYHLGSFNGIFTREHPERVYAPVWVSRAVYFGMEKANDSVHTAQPAPFHVMLSTRFTSLSLSR